MVRSFGGGKVRLDDLCGQQGRMLSSGPPAHPVSNDDHALGLIENKRVLVLDAPESSIGDTGGLPSEGQKGSMPEGSGSRS